MGLVELIPGVSGGTMALILGIYERLINALSEINIVFFHKILAGRLKEAWYQADLTFLVVLVLGSLVAAISFSSIIIFFQNHYPLFLQSFFSGLLFTSLFFRPLRPDTLNLKFFLGSLLALLIVSLIWGLPPISIKEANLLYVFFGGFVAVCAFILPGISGSFILLLLGLYSLFVLAINEFDLVFLATMLSGGLLGLFFFIRIVKKAFSAYRQFLSGFFYLLVFLSIPLIWKKNIWEISFIQYEINYFEAIFGVFLGILFMSLLQKIPFIFQDT